MNKIDCEVEIKSCFAEMVTIIRNSIVSLVANQTWAKAILEERYSSRNTGASLAKFRIHLRNGERLSCFDPPDGTAGLSLEAFKLRKNLAEDRWWYGVTITVYPDGSSDITFDYDPECMQKMDMTT